MFACVEFNAFKWELSTVRHSVEFRVCERESVCVCVCVWGGGVCVCVCVCVHLHLTTCPLYCTRSSWGVLVTGSSGCCTAVFLLPGLYVTHSIVLLTSQQS